MLWGVKFHSVGKTNQNRNKKMDLNITNVVDGCLQSAWVGVLQVCRQFKTMGMNFSRSSKLFKNTRLVNMIHCRMFNVSPKRNRVNESVWQTLVKASFHMEDKANSANELMLQLMAQQHLCNIFQTQMEVFSNVCSRFNQIRCI